MYVWQFMRHQNSTNFSQPYPATDCATPIRLFRIPACSLPASAPRAQRTRIARFIYLPVLNVFFGSDIPARRTDAKLLSGTARDTIGPRSGSSWPAYALSGISKLHSCCQVNFRRFTWLTLMTFPPFPFVSLSFDYFISSVAQAATEIKTIYISFVAAAEPSSACLPGCCCLGKL